MVKITLSLWDTGGQKRFDFFKTDFFNGCAAVGLVFDLARPDTFDSIDEYFQLIRKKAGNIPIILIGNKSDLKETIGETIERKKIIEKVNKFNLLEYIETSALENINVDYLFNRLSICALMELKPHLGEIVNENHFRLKVLLAGAAAVGKSSLIKTFTSKNFENDYKLTVGLDFMIKDFEIPDEDLPEEVHDIINRAIDKWKRAKKRIKEEKLEISPESQKKKKKQKVLTNNLIYFALIILGIILFVVSLVHFII
ncbi:MAG: GTP-binding protein [Promethearchaeia archaeon]